MKEFVPTYYRAFSCIAGECRHSCCIGWEIDIDDIRAKAYRTFPGEIGARMQTCIDFDADPPHFILQGDEERCPFLNADGLCDIILTCGEGALCQICTDHPRWRNFFSDRTEIGIGLCCEAAAALVLGYDAPVTFLCLSDDGSAERPTGEERAFFSLRDTLLAILQDRTKPFEDRVGLLLAYVGGVRYPDLDLWRAFLLRLEILDRAWSDRLARIGCERAAMPGHAAEQFSVYLLTRHLPKVLDGEDASVVVSFAVLALDIVSALFAQCEVQDFAALCDIVRLFSSEIEYSEDNLYAIFDEIASS